MASRLASGVAEELIRNPAPSNVARTESYGKILDDRIRREAAALRDEITAKNDQVAASLESNISRTVEFAVGFVLLMSLAVLYLALRSALDISRARASAFDRRPSASRAWRRMASDSGNDGRNRIRVRNERSRRRRRSVRRMAACRRSRSDHDRRHERQRRRRGREHCVLQVLDSRAAANIWPARSCHDRIQSSVCEHRQRPIDVRGRVFGRARRA